MQHNVAHILKRPRALPQRQSQYQLAVVRFYADEAAKNEDTKVEKSIQQLRALDQKTLYETKIKNHRFIKQVEKIKSIASSIPTTIKNRDIPVPYTLGFLRTVVKDNVPDLADKTIAAANNIHEHLSDLQVEPYESRDRDAETISELEKEIEGLNQQQKEELLKSWQYEEEAMIGRVEKQSQKLSDYVQDVLRAKSKEEAGVAGSALREENPFIPPEAGKVRAVESSPSLSSATSPAINSADKGDEGPADSEKQSMGLADLQKQLAAKMKQEQSRKSYNSK